MKRSRKFRLGAAVVAGGLALGGLGWLAAVKYVSSPRLDIVDKKRTVAKIVTTVDLNTPVTVIAKEGRWYKVEVNGKQGYAAEMVLADKPVNAKKVSLGEVTGGPVPRLDTAAAVKGLNDNAAKYATNTGLSTSGLLELQRRREAISPDEFDRFLQQGGLAGATAARDGDDEADAVAADIK